MSYNVMSSDRCIIALNHLINPHNNLPGQRPRLPNRTRQTTPPPPANNRIPSLLSTKRPYQDLHVRPKLPLARLCMHLGKRREARLALCHGRRRRRLQPLQDGGLRHARHAGHAVDHEDHGFGSSGDGVRGEEVGELAVFLLDELADVDDFVVVGFV